MKVLRVGSGNGFAVCSDQRISKLVSIETIPVGLENVLQGLHAVRTIISQPNPGGTAELSPKTRSREELTCFGCFRQNSHRNVILSEARHKLIA
jgi:hypothetical protein